MKKLSQKWYLRGCPELEKYFLELKEKGIYTYWNGNIPHLYYTSVDEIEGHWTSFRKEQEGYREITFEQFKKVILNMKTQLLGLPIIKGEPHHLQAFMKDCEKFGYEVRKGYELKSLNKDMICLFEDYKSLFNNYNYRPEFNHLAFTIDKEYGKDIPLPVKEFNLPQDWSNALKFMQENIELWEQIQKENKESEITYKAGDWVLVQGKNHTGNYVGNGLKGNTIVQLIEEGSVESHRVSGNLEGKFVFVDPKDTKNYLRTEDRYILRHATEEEILANQFKIGDIVVFDPILAKKEHRSSTVWDKPWILRIYEIKEQDQIQILVFTSESMREAGCSNSAVSKNSGTITCSNGAKYFRKATPEEIKEYNSRVKIFQMTSSNGNFELEVSKKGIYYRPEETWLTENPINIAPRLLHHTKGNYEVSVEVIKVGCKSGTLISEWKKVYDYYNSIKD